MDTNTKTAETAKYSTANDNTFASEVLNSDQPVLVDFWANWCGPCRMIAPVVEGLAAQYEGKARVVKVDVDENPALCGQYGIRSIPALLIFKNGKVVDQVVGVVSRTVLTEKLNAQLWRPTTKIFDGSGTGGNFTG